ncbi:hypothetical protein [uncultured Fusobacterium sp.]|uniref:hypothetical protein n=1 Tax=uncultured Fusobacterium sp. TaxID=159267 RepID=UPI0027DBF921|nr:hypothetical protein [uncultured Fusobacterium sp.]
MKFWKKQLLISTIYIGIMLIFYNFSSNEVSKIVGSLLTTVFVWVMNKTFSIDYQTKNEKELKDYQGKIDKEMEDYKNEWNQKLEDYKNKLDAELETHKAKLSGYTLVTKLQYELEFKIYTEIYELIQLNFQTVAGMVNDIKSNRKRDNHLEIIKKYNETGASVLSNTLKNRPFYQEEIFNSILKIDGINKKICDIYVNFIENSIITEDAEKLATDVGKRLINLSILIRKRIENMKIIEG